MKNRGIYIHYPFCSKICNYCDFAVDTRKELSKSYINSVINEIVSNFSEAKNQSNITTIYIGGGTPSLMTPDDLTQIIESIKLNFSVDENLEFSMEINPGTIDYEKFMEFRNLGVNRVSIGVQSFQKRELGLISRNHSPKSAIKAIEDANKAGFRNISLDLMFSLPYQNLKTLEENLNVALDLPINHISTYSLIYEPGTPLYNKMKKGEVKKHGDEIDAEMYLRTIEILAENDFEQYEVSNFAKDGVYCKHNLNAWHGEEYFAFGVSAHGYIDGVRFANTRNLNNYIKSIKEKRNAIDSKETLSSQTKYEELFFLGLRADGVDLNNFHLSKNFNELLNDFIEKEFISEKSNFISLNPKGYLHCDTITFKLLNELNPVS